MARPKIALIGCGHFGRYHCRNLSQLSEYCDFVGIYDRTLEKAEEASREVDCPVFREFDQILSAGVDAIDIVTSTASHYEIAKECLERNISLFVEKPITDSHARSTELVELAIKNGVSFRVGFIERFGAYLPEIVSLTKDAVEIEVERTTKGDRKENEDIINDLMIHDLDLLLNYCFPSVKPEVTGAYIIEAGSLYEVSLSFNGTRVSIIAGKGISEVKRSYTFKGDLCYRVDLASNEVQLFNGNDNKTRKLADVNKLYVELKSFIDELNSSKPTDESVLRGYLASSELVERIKTRIVKRKT